MHEPTISRKDFLDPSGDDENFRHFIHDLQALSTRLDVIRSGFGELVNLTGVEFSMLVATGHLNGHGPVYVNVLADYLHLSGAFVTLQTNQLAKKGMIKKVKDAEDGRRVQLTVTKRAENTLKILAPAQCQVNDVMFNGFSKSDFKKFASSVELLLEGSAKALPLLDYLRSQRNQRGK